MLLRSVLVNVPLAVLLTAVAVHAGAARSGGHRRHVRRRGPGGRPRRRALHGLGGRRPAPAPAAGGQPAAPTFVLFLGGMAVVVGAVLVWVELLLRAAAVYVAVLFLPLALASLAWPAISHWCRRLVDTLVALVLSKFVIVAVLSLAVGALAAGTGSTPAGADAVGRGLRRRAGWRRAPAPGRVGPVGALPPAAVPRGRRRRAPRGAQPAGPPPGRRPGHRAWPTWPSAPRRPGPLATGPVGVVGVAAGPPVPAAAGGRDVRAAGGGDPVRRPPRRAAIDPPPATPEANRADAGPSGPQPWEPGGVDPRCSPRHPIRRSTNRRLADIAAGRDPYAEGPAPGSSRRGDGQPADAAGGVLRGTAAAGRPGRCGPTTSVVTTSVPCSIGRRPDPGRTGTGDRWLPTAPTGSATGSPPLERRGVIAGWRGGQVAAVAVGLVLACSSCGAGRRSPVCCVAVDPVGAAAWPWPSGRSPDAPASSGCPWSCGGPGPPPPVDRVERGHRARQRGGGDRWTPTAGDRSSVVPVRPWPRRRSAFDGLRPGRRTATGPDRPRQWGRASTSGPGTATAVLAVRGHSFALLGPAEQDARVAGLGPGAGGLAREGSAVHRLQWIESCLPDDGSAVRSHCADHARARRRRPGRAVLPASARRVVAGHPPPPGPRGRLGPHRGRRRACRPGLGRRGRGRRAVLAREVVAVSAALDGADIGRRGVLGPRGPGRRRPGRRRPSGIPRRRPPAGAGRDTVPSRMPWPMAVGAGLGRRADRRHVARHLLDRRVAPGRRHPRLPRTAAVLPAAPHPRP